MENDCKKAYEFFVLYCRDNFVRNFKEEKKGKDDISERIDIAIISPEVSPETSPKIIEKRKYFQESDNVSWHETISSGTITRISTKRRRVFLLKTLAKTSATLPRLEEAELIQVLDQM
mmetsp:Transcript_18634/g.28079  ORF Transcript_18634/g.28079 Transcript_18634/m.28079 type:complete len:118 (-) Transcript_18634:206-559(-)